METNEKTIVPQHAGTKRKWRIGCVVIITALVILGWSQEWYSLDSKSNIARRC